MSTPDVETIVVGAGVVGLAVARALAEAGHEVHGARAARADRLGNQLAQQRGDPRRHLLSAGQPARDAVRARQGAALPLLRGATACRTPRCGKLLVATHESQLPKLAAIKETAAKNGVTDLEPIGGNAARDLEPELSCVAALISPSTGIIDSHGLMLALEGHIEATRRLGRAALPGRAHRAHAARPLPADHRRRQRRAPSPAATSCCRRACMPSKLAATLDFGDGYRPPADLLRQGPVLRALRPLAVQAPHLSAAGRRLARPACHRRHRRALQVRPRHRMDRRHRLQLRAGEAGRSSWTSSAATIRASTPTRLHADYTGIRPKLYREGEPVPDFAIHGADKHGHEASSRSTASRAPASRRRWRSARRWRACCLARKPVGRDRGRAPLNRRLPWRPRAGRRLRAAARASASSATCRSRRSRTRGRRRRSRSSPSTARTTSRRSGSSCTMPSRSNMPMMRTRLVSLNRPMKRVDDAGDHQLQRLRQDDEPHLLRVGEAERIGRLELPARDGLQAAADDLGQIGGREQRHPISARSSLSMVTPAGRNSGSITEAMNSTVISGTPRTNSMKPTETQRTIGIFERRPSASRMPSGNGAGDADAGDDQRHEQAAPQIGRHVRQAEHAADQQDEGEDRKDDEHVDRRSRACPARAGSSAARARRGPAT